MYFLAFLVGIGVLYSPCELKVVRNYLIALWVADLGHMLITAEALGWEGTVDVRGWNAMTWGNLGVTVSFFFFLFLFFHLSVFFSRVVGVSIVRGVDLGYECVIMHEADRYMCRCSCF